MPDGPDALKKWIEKRGLAQQEVAELLEVHESYVSQVLHRKRTPALANAVRIERITGIPVEAWLPKRPPKAPKTILEAAATVDLAK